MQHPTRFALVLASALALSSCALLPIRPHLAVVDEAVDQPQPLPEVITFESGLDLGWRAGVLPEFARDPGWLATTAGSSATFYELVDPGCLLFVHHGSASSIVLEGANDFEATSFAIGEHLASNRFEAETLEWNVSGSTSRVVAMAVVSEASGSQTITVARVFAGSRQQLLISLTCEPGVDSLAVFAGRVASKAPIVLTAE